MSIYTFQIIIITDFNLFLLLSNFKLDRGEKKRQIYVALTRAKNNLQIHTNQPIFKNIICKNQILINDTTDNARVNTIIMQLSHKDVWLDYFENTQAAIKKLVSGANLHLKETNCYAESGELVLKFSSKFIEQIKEMQKKSYVLYKIKVKHIVYWKSEKKANEFLIFIPTVEFRMEV